MLRHLQTIRLGVIELAPHVQHAVVIAIPKSLNEQLVKLERDLGMASAPSIAVADPVAVDDIKPGGEPLPGVKARAVLIHADVFHSPIGGKRTQR